MSYSGNIEEEIEKKIWKLEEQLKFYKNILESLKINKTKIMVISANEVKKKNDVEQSALDETFREI